mmetsp:Transcript_62893/g.166864  ORF Transcript_62893/g.166864 Transcript_62893/m.166864 type:complete len:350 (+) Transcript_62893:120-1169(+)
MFTGVLDDPTKRQDTRLASCGRFLQCLQTEIVIEQSWTKLALQRLDHFLVLRHIQRLTELHQLHGLLRLRRARVNVPLVHLENTRGHVRIGLEGLVWVTGTGHKIALGKILGEQCAVDLAQLLLWDAGLLVELEGAEEELHVEIWTHALHLVNDLRYIRHVEAFERTLRVIDACQHWQKAHAAVVPEHNLHHIGLVVMALGVTQRLLLHQERSRCSVASTHAHRAPVTDHAGREQATQRHVGREIAVCVHDKVGIVTDRLHEGCVLGRPTQSVQNGTSLPALLRVLQLAIADEERDLLIDGLLQIDEPHIVITLLRHDFPRQSNAVVGTAVIHGQDVPCLPFLSVKEPL